MQDLLAGQIDLMIDQPAISLPQVRAGTIKAYAVTAKSRLAAAPDIPTVDEAGAARRSTSPFWHALWAPKGTPKDVIAKLNARGRRRARRSCDAHSGSPISGRRSPPREQQTPEALAAFHKAEIDKWWPIIKAAEHQG